MTNPPAFADRVRAVLTPTPRGVVGLVDDLLAVGRDQPLRLDFDAGRCRVSRPDGAVAEVALPPAVFRAALARVAALCNDRHPASVTPYAGRGELTAGTDPAAGIAVAFSNTAAEQWLELGPAGAAAAAAGG